MNSNILIKCIVVFLFSGIIDANAKIVDYLDPNIQWLGRWNEETGVGRWSGWTGSQIVFKVHGSMQIKVNAGVIDPDTSNSCFITVKVDNSSTQYTSHFFTSQKEVFSGNRTVIIPLGDTLAHTIIIHTVGSNHTVFRGLQKTIIKSFEVDDTGDICFWDQGEKMLQVVGDSWMATENDYPRFLDREKWCLYPISAGGLRVIDMESQYDFNYENSFSDDPQMSAILVSFGVNDLFGNISATSYEEYLYYLLRKIRAKQPLIPIYLVQVPENYPAGMDFGVYGKAMEDLARIYENVFYISTRSIEKSLTWKTDNKHLSNSSKLTFASFIDEEISYLETNGKVYDKKVSVRIYPNLTQDAVFVENFGKTNTLLAKVYSLTGTLLLTEAIEEEFHVLSLSELPSGYYLIQLSGEEVLIAEKVCKSD